MKIVCDSCGAKYSIADEKVAGKIFKIRCKKCSSVLEVRGDQTGTHPFEGSQSSQNGGGDATWYIVVDGEQKGPLAPIELSQLFAKGSVGLDSYVWKEGFDDWKVAGEVPELTQIFGGAGAPASAEAATDDTSAFTTGRDLFGDEGREPTGEIEPSGMFGNFDEKPTPTDAGDAPLAAAAASPDGDLQPGGAAMGAGAAPQRMTGQRNENSVLFSLSNLQQLASRGGGSPSPSAASEPAPAPQPSPQAAGEGSGLIDIRALAKSTTPGTKAAPSQAVDDLLAIGTGAGGAALNGPLLGPAPLEASGGNRWLWIGGAGLALLLFAGALGIGMMLGGPDDTLEITGADPAQTEGAVASNDTPAVAAGPAGDPGARAVPPSNPSPEAAAIEPPAPALPEPGSETEPATAAAEPPPKKRSTSSSAKRKRTASTDSRSAAPAPAPAPKKRGGNLDALMDEVVGGSSPSKPKAKRTSSSSSSNSNLPETPSRGDVKTALQGVSGSVKTCKKSSGGTATVNVTFSGKTGRATGAKVTSGPFKGTPVGKCVESAVKRARVPRFQQSVFKVTFPYRL